MRMQTHAKAGGGPAREGCSGIWHSPRAGHGPNIACHHERSAACPPESQISASKLQVDMPPRVHITHSAMQTPPFQERSGPGREAEEGAPAGDGGRGLRRVPSEIIGADAMLARRWLWFNY